MSTVAEPQVKSLIFSRVRDRVRRWLGRDQGEQDTEIKSNSNRRPHQPHNPHPPATIRTRYNVDGIREPHNLDSNKYVRYSPLDDPLNQIRLIQIKPSAADDDVLSLTISKHDRGNAPPYHALSYTWGDERVLHRIRINHCPFYIRDCLWHLLIELRRKQKRRTDKTYFWADAICIDQNATQERNNQVQQMQHIYLSAKITVAYLGPASENSDCAMEFLDEWCDHTIDKFQELRQLQKNGKWCDTEGRASALYDLIVRREYWRRLWIVQEVLLSREVLFGCGRHFVRDSRLKTFFAIAESLSVPQQRNGLNHEWGSLAFRKIASSNARKLQRGSVAANKVRFPNLIIPLFLYQDHDCSVRLDKVYALMSLVDAKAGQGLFEVDYSRTPDELREIVIQYAGNVMPPEVHGALPEWLRLSCFWPYSRRNFPTSNDHETFDRCNSTISIWIHQNYLDPVGATPDMAGDCNGPSSSSPPRLPPQLEMAPTEFDHIQVSDGTTI